MAGFNSFGSLGQAARNGQIHTCHFRKVPSQATSATSMFFDMSMAPGDPQPNYYASSPLEAAKLQANRGLFHGADKAPASKFLLEAAILGNAGGCVGEYKLLDYLLYYPFVDLDSIDEQTLVNDLSIDRYTSGEGVRAMFVAASPTVGGGSFSYTYINQDGIQRTSPIISYSTGAVNIASMLTTQAGAASGGQLFLPLANGDTGIRSIVSLQNIAAHGGLGSLVLVKELAELSIFEASVPSEVNFLTEHPAPPRIYDGAYLGFVGLPTSTIAGALYTGRLTFVWS